MSSTLGPTQTGERIVALDVLRGFALFGVFVANTAASARPFEEALDAPPPGSPVAETAAWFVVHAFVFNKFVALFSLLFGMGLVLQMQRAAAKGRPFVGTYLRRLGVLAAMGVLHGCLLFEGDILLPYAVVGLCLFLCRNLGPRTLVILGLFPLLFGTVLGLAWEFIDLSSWGEDELDLEIQRVKKEGPLLEFLLYRVLDYGYWLLASTVTPFNWRVIALFFFGAAVMKSGLLEDRFAGLHRRLAVIALPLGAAAETAAVWFSRRPDAVDRLPGVLLTEYGSLVLSAGYAGLVLTAVRAGLFAPVQRGLASVGRTALTNYLAQSVLMNLLFFWFGLNLYDEISRAALLGVTALLFGLQVALSSLWMSRFSSGPAEWLWRSLTYRKIVRWR